MENICVSSNVVEKPSNTGLDNISVKNQKDINPLLLMLLLKAKDADDLAGNLKKASEDHGGLNMKLNIFLLNRMANSLVGLPQLKTICI